VDDISLTLGIHPQTIRQWIRNGLPTIDEGKPSLIWGECLKRHIHKMNDALAVATAFDEFYCFHCHKSHMPLERKVAIEHLGGFVRATGICTENKKTFFKNYKIDDIPQLQQKFTLTELARLYDSADSTYNTHILINKGLEENKPPAQITFPDNWLNYGGENAR
jgi:hypothetical protein